MGNEMTRLQCASLASCSFRNRNAIKLLVPRDDMTTNEEKRGLFCRITVYRLRGSRTSSFVRARQTHTHTKTRFTCQRKTSFVGATCRTAGKHKQARKTRAGSLTTLHHGQRPLPGTPSTLFRKTILTLVEVFQCVVRCVSGRFQVSEGSMDRLTMCVVYNTRPPTLYNLRVRLDGTISSQRDQHDFQSSTHHSFTSMYLDWLTCV